MYHRSGLIISRSQGCVSMLVSQGQLALQC